MGRLFIEIPQAACYEWVAAIWVRWLDAFAPYYPQGREGTMLRMRELVHETPYVEYAPITMLHSLLARNRDTPESPSESITDNLQENNSLDEE